jgi:hypothetical protein
LYDGHTRREIDISSRHFNEPGFESLGERVERNNVVCLRVEAMDRFDCFMSNYCRFIREHPTKIAEVATFKEVCGIASRPDSESGDAIGADYGVTVSISVNEDTRREVVRVESWKAMRYSPVEELLQVLL